MTALSEPGLNAFRLHVFHIEAPDAPDVMLRVLAPFARACAGLPAIHLARTNSGVAIRIETEGLSDDHAETLRRQLSNLPSLTAVGLGWRTISGAV